MVKMSEQKGKIDKELLIRFLEGAGSEEDENIIQDWLKDPESESELNKESFRLWEEIKPDIQLQDYNGDRILDRIHHRIKIEESVFITSLKSGSGLVSYLKKIAAILVLPFQSAIQKRHRW